MYTAVQASGRKKHEPLNEYISLSEDLNLFLLDNPESRMIAQENMEKKYQLIDKQLSSMERQVLKLYLEGGSYEEIAEEMGRSEKSVDNAIQRLKKKLKKVEKSVDTRETLWYYNQVASASDTKQAAVAQSVERRIGSAEVTGPIPVSSFESGNSIEFPLFLYLLLACWE